jgi:antibiotic biosynthesis monooxygenase (ABM) superfamily enzyme
MLQKFILRRYCSQILRREWLDRGKILRFITQSISRCSLKNTWLEAKPDFQIEGRMNLEERAKVYPVSMKLNKMVNMKGKVNRWGPMD